MTRVALSALVFAAAASVIPPAAFAQPAPPSISFERRALEPQVESQAQPPEAPEAPAAVAPVAPDAATILLRDVRLEGATALSRDELADLWAPLIGTPVALADLEALAAQIGARYRGRGFVLSQAALPAQRVEDGVVTIRVVEGFIDAVRVEGGDQTGTIAARRFLAPISEDRPLRLERLERGVLLTRDALGPDVETVLEPSPDTFGAADMTVLLPEEKQTTGFLAVDNRASRLYGAWTVTGGLTAYDMAGLTERVDLLASFAPNDDYLAFGELSVSVPPRAFDGGVLDGTRVEFVANHVRGEPDLEKSSGGDGFSAVQRETNVSLALATPFVRTRSENLFGHLSLTARDSYNRTKSPGDALTLEDRLWVLEARGVWDHADSFGGVTLLDIGLRQGLDFAGADIEGGDIRGEPDFTVIDASVARLQRIGDTDWSVYGLLVGQLAGATLPDSERFGLGGDRLGRGFAPGNTSGDSGFGGRLELRRTIGTDALDNVVAGAQLYAFGDWGQAVDREEARDGARWETLGSVGAGVRLDVTPTVTLIGEITQQVAGAPVDQVDDDRETRGFVTLVKRF